ncbi:MAG TPA: addiction module protein [Gemmataceae bacterium]|nr:addiction module protein [Gemmataceae bacterium]
MTPTKPVTKADVLELAKALSVEERCELIDDLEATISPIPEGMTHQEFRAELDRRWEEYQSGKVQGMTVDEVIAEARRQFNGHG